ncbi:MAG: endonuclease III [Patescibacteria group bacterium]|nr:endonuclease III [Patescibacteria group bacterium]
MSKQREASRHAATIARRLKKHYAEAKCSLDFNSPLELLVATILSAQCTDARVNLVTPALFGKYPTVAHYASVPQEELEAGIRSTGFFRNKAKNIRACCQAMLEKHDGQVPRSMEDLVALPGLGRKSANVILGTAFGIGVGVVVDTHVTRLSQRLGLTKHKNAEKIERDLMALFPQSQWIDVAHQLVFHGRRVCTARKPQCVACPLNDICPGREEVASC